MSDLIPVIILNWNGWEDTRECLRSIDRLDEAYNLWVVDNGSDEDHCESLASEFPHVRFMQLGENYGWAGGYNRALKVAVDEGYKAAYLLNNDTLVEPGFLRRISCSTSKGRWAAIGSQVLHGDGKSVRFDGVYYENGAQSFQKREGTVSVERVNGGAMLINLEAFKKVGPFDERFFCYGEESDWCDRSVTIFGYSNYVCLDSMVRHYCEGSNVSGNSLYFRTRNKFIKTEMHQPDFFELLSHGYRRAQRHAQAGRHTDAIAVLCGIQDGERERFGRRASNRPTVWTRVLFQMHRSYRVGRAVCWGNVRLRRK